MLKTYIKLAWRNFRSNKLHFLINIGGLAIGMSVAILIGLWIYDEVYFDRSFKNYNRIARVMQSKITGVGIQTTNVTPYPLAEVLRKDYGSHFDQVVLSSGIWPYTLSIGSKKLSQSGVFFEPNGPELLSLNMLSGKRNGLADPGSIFLSESASKALFGNSSPIGKIVNIDNAGNLPVKVTGVYEDMPYNSTFSDVKFIAPWKLFFDSNGLKNMEDPWRPNSFTTYVLMAENADIENVSAAIKDVRLNHVNSRLAQQKPALFLQPMNRWHLYAEFKNGVNVGGRIQYVWLFATTGIFVLLLACINFMNLSTASSEKRAKEVGIRKVIGSQKSQLVKQFFTESFLVVVLAFSICIILVSLSLPFFNEVAGKKTAILWANPAFWLICLTFCTVTGIVAGIYPAFYLSSFKPIKVLKGAFSAGKSSFVSRKVLVVVQFTVSVVLIIGTLMVFKQIQFVKDRPVGYNRAGLIMVRLPSAEIHNHFDIVQRELQSTGSVVSVTESDAPATEVYSTSTGYEWKGKDPTVPAEFNAAQISYNYGKTVGWEFVAGRDFSKEFPGDSTGVILNETAARFMGLETPVGENITRDGKVLTIIGVVRDIVVESPYLPVKPSVFRFLDYPAGILMVRTNPEINPKVALAHIEKIYKKYNANEPFNFSFVDEDYARKFGNEERVGTLSGFFAGLAILISCLGLFGMASFMAEQRKKEIGIRKVLGATVMGIWQMLSKDFVKLIVISIVISIPIAWYVINSWLQNYSYRSEIPVSIFIVAGLTALLITILTISFQAIRAALMNPVRSLRSE
ncbi:MAG: ABC transporter permease [Bacteroidota bacterium]